MKRLRATTLRVRLTALVVVLLGAGLVVSSLLATAALRGYLLDRVDEQLQAGARPFSAFPEGLPRPTNTEEQGPRPPSRFYLSVVDATGTVVLSDPNDTSQSDPAIPADVRSAPPGPFTVHGVDGRGEWRVLITPLPAQQGWTVAAVPLGDVDATVGRLFLLQGIVGVVVVVIAGAVGYLLVRRSLRPLDEMAATSRAIAEGDLSLRVPDLPESTEVGTLAASFNTMVTRIEESFDAQVRSEAEARASEERMRRFVADAGHELRTPLTSIRGYAELIEQGAAPDPGQAVQRIQSEAVRMSGLVDDLQLLARLDEQRPMRTEPVDLASVCTAAVAAAGVQDPGRRIELTVAGQVPTVMGDEDRLRQVMDNLLSNALRYSSDGTSVEVTVDPVSEPFIGAQVLVRDHGPGLSEDEAARVFDRLYRTDEARTRVDGGSGLGLAIVRSIVEAHEGTVSVDPRPGEGATFGFTLPAAR